VLGPTGRNFAAGMSGGIAYVLDEPGTFASRCNRGMVELEEVGEADAIELRALIEEHRDRTDSPVAARVLADWDAMVPRFVKVMPTDYKRVLAELAVQEQGARNGVAPGDATHDGAGVSTAAGTAPSAA